MNEQGIMEKLCSGVNPVTGKLLDTPRDPEIDEARVKYFRLLGTRVKAIEKAKAKAENTAPKNTGGKQWLSGFECVSGLKKVLDVTRIARIISPMGRRTVHRPGGFRESEAGEKLAKLRKLK